MKLTAAGEYDPKADSAFPKGLGISPNRTAMWTDDGSALAFGIVVFVLPRTPDEAPIARGAHLGLVVYGVYDLSNLSNLKRGPVLLTAVDIAWGGVASAATTWLVATGHRFLH